MDGVSPVNPLSSSYLQSILTSALQGVGSTTGQTNNSLTGTDALSSVAQKPDSSRLSNFAQMLNTLQQLQQSDPAKYQQVTSQIAANLQTAANTATSNGNTSQAAQLNQLATDFTNASQSNALPSIQDLAKALGGGHGHHHHHMRSSSSDSDSASTTASGTSTAASSASASSTAVDDLSKLIASYLLNSTSSTQNTALDPMAIINNTLTTAGISLAQ